MRAAARVVAVAVAVLVPAVAAAVKPGDAVVARWGSGSFYEGKVDSVADGKAKVRWADGSSPSEVSLAEVFSRPGAAARPTLAVGELVLAKYSSTTRWYGARVKAVTPPTVVLVYASDGNEKTVPMGDVVKVPAPVRDEIRQEEEQTAIRSAAAKRQPPRPSGWKPRKDEAVVAIWAVSKWYGGKVVEVKGAGVIVAWADGSSPSEVKLERVVPLEQRRRVAARGQYLLVKPTAGATWLFGQAAEVKGDKVVARLESGAPRTLAKEDYLVLE
jgi:hypothetical protein